MKKRNYRREKEKYFFKKTLIYQVMLSFLCIFLCIGYAKVNDIKLYIDGLASAEIQKGLFISSVNILNNENGTNQSEILDSRKTMLNTKVVLDNKDDSEVSYEISLFNNSNVAYVYYKTTPTSYDIDFYDNKYITYEIDDTLTQGYKIEENHSHKFVITFKYVDGLDFNNLPDDFSNVLNAYIYFNFKELNNVAIGDNIFDSSTKIDNTYVNNTNGKIVEYSGWSSSDYMDISSYKYLIITTSSGQMLDNWNAVYDENYNYVKTVNINKSLVNNNKLGNLYLNLNVLKVDDSFKYLRISATTSLINGVKIYPILNDDFNMILDYNIEIFQLKFGENIYNTSDNTINSYIKNTDGKVTGYNGWQSSNYIDVSNYKKVAISSDSTALLTKWNAFYDSDNNFVKSFDCSGLTIYYNKNIGYYKLLNIPSDVKYMRVSEKNSIMNKIKIYPILENSVEEASNLNVGENFYSIDENVANSYISSSNGGEIVYNGWSSSNYINVEDHDNWIIVGGNSFLSEWNAFYDENKSYISGFNCSYSKLNNKILGSQSASMCVIQKKPNVKYLRISEENSILKNIRIYPITNEDYNGVLTFEIIK